MDTYKKYSVIEIASDTSASTSGFKFINAPPDSLIHDARGLSNFKQQTLGGHKKQEVISGLDKAISQGQIEMACYWSIQLLCSGYVNQLWEKLTTYAMKHVNIACPLFPQWLASKSRLWHTVIDDKKEFSKGGILHIRNLQQFRNIIVEVVVVLCQARKRKLDTCGAKVTDQDFVVATFANKCVARKTNYLSGLIGANDTREVIIAANEFYHHLLNKNIEQALYWINWILNWEKQNIRRHKSFQVQPRQIEGVSDKYQRDVMWLIWSIFHHVRQRMLDSTRAQNSISPIGSDQIAKIELQLNALWDMYIHDWKPGAKARKLPLLIWSIQYLIYPLDWSIPVISNLGTYVKACASINKMYVKVAQTQSTNYIAPNSNHPGASIDTILQNNYIPMGPTPSNPISMGAIPAPPLQINTQRMAPIIEPIYKQHSPKTIGNARNTKGTKINGRSLTSDDKAKLEWMSIMLQ